MRRREFITLLGGATAWPLAARAQPEARRVGMLLAAYTQNDNAGQVRVEVFRKSLQVLGRTERNITFDTRFGNGDPGRFKTLASELVQSAPDVIVVAGDPALAELHRLQTTLPIVFTQVSDPVNSGFAASLARPGGNITGFQNFEPEMGGKWLGLLKEIFPRLNRVGVLLNRGAAPHAVFLRAAETAAVTLGLNVAVAHFQSAEQIERAIISLAGEPGTGLIILPHPLTIANRSTIHAAALRYRLPAIYPYRYFATDGGLTAYGPDQIDQWRGAAGYVDRILRGEKPADLPVQAPTKYEFVINLKTAKALGIDIPPMLLARADEVIERSPHAANSSPWSAARRQCARLERRHNNRRCR
jgi:putative ABC transport system substrate-binding protein